MMYKCTTNCPILSDNCIAIRQRKWTWAPLMTHLCDSCAHAGVCDTDILYDNTNVVECTYYDEEDEQGGRAMNLCDSCDVCFNDGTVPVLTCSCYDEEADNE